jgi:branched-chain amino acid transport system permease protein
MPRGAIGRIWRRLTDGASLRAVWMLAALLGLLVVAPQLLHFAGGRSRDFLITVLALALYFAYVGQAWNVMMGFAGQLSLGHALYLGLGSYAAAALYMHYGIGPWAGVFLAIAACVLVGSVIGFLGFRFSLSGVYFALLTIAFAEFTRIAFDHWTFVGGSAGLFLKVESRDVTDVLNLRGSPTLFYYVMLALTVAAFLLCRWLLAGRLGHQWLAIREDPEAAQAAGINVLRARLAAVALSAGMTAVAGVWNAFYYNNLFPESAFAMGRSIELTLAPILGGLGTLFGPIVGAAILVGLGESFTAATESLRIPGLKQIFYGVALLVIVVFLPGGVWPWLARRLRVDRPSRSDPP